MQMLRVLYSVPVSAVKLKVLETSCEKRCAEV
jgi:hypothetical protein